VFEIVNGKCHDKKDITDTKKSIYPLIGASKDNNGIVGYMETYDYEKGFYTLSSFGTCGYLFKQNQNFNIRGHGSIFVLKCKYEKFNDNINLNLITIQLNNLFCWTNAITKLNYNKIKVYIYED
jgi:hypothetical protein